MQNFPGSRLPASAPVPTAVAAGHRPALARGLACAQARERLFCAIADLDHAIAAWIVTPAAWDQRAHPSIRQFLVDIREYAAALECGGKVSPNIIVAAAGRLASKVHHVAVDQCVAVLHAALDNYVQALHA